MTLTDVERRGAHAPDGHLHDAGANTNAAGQCTITFTSTTAGKVTGHASSTLSVGRLGPFTVADGRRRPNSGDAVKTFVDANIQITPRRRRTGSARRTSSPRTST